MGRLMAKKSDFDGFSLEMRIWAHSSSTTQNGLFLHLLVNTYLNKWSTHILRYKILTYGFERRYRYSTVTDYTLLIQIECEKTASFLPAKLDCLSFHCFPKSLSLVWRRVKNGEF